jgi:hypothetical protein
MIAVKLRVLPSRRATLIKLAAQLGPVRTSGRARAAILGCPRILSPERTFESTPLCFVRWFEFDLHTVARSHDGAGADDPLSTEKGVNARNEEL